MLRRYLNTVACSRRGVGSGLPVRHHMCSIIVLVTLVSALEVSGHYSGQGNTETDTEAPLTGSNVCTRNETSQGFTKIRKWYPCVTWSWKRCKRKRKFPRWRPRRRRCIVYRHGMCSRLEWHAVPTPVVRRFCCEGYEETANRTCQKSSACSFNNGGCNQICHQTDNAGHICLCFHGYKKMSSSDVCIDINECSSNNGGCAQRCINTEGSYYCACTDGYENIAGNCKDIEECRYGNGGCEHSCINTPGSYRCQCQDGYRMTQIYYCNDVDECSTNNGGCSHGCQNWDGGYECDCPMGFALLEDNRTCEAQPRPLPNLQTAPTSDDTEKSTLQTSFTTTRQPTTSQFKGEEQINNNNSSVLALRGNRTQLLYGHLMFPVVGVLSFLVLFAVLAAVALVYRKYIRKPTADGERVYCIPDAPVTEHVYAVPAIFNTFKRPQVVVAKTGKELAFENQTYEY